MVLATNHATSMDYGMVYFLLSLVTAPIATFLIVTRILLMARGTRLRTYSGIIEIVVESELLYSLVFVLFLIFKNNDVGVVYLQAILVQVTVCSFFFHLQRVR